MPQKSLLREHMRGAHMEDDRLWRISGGAGTGVFVCGLTDYNWEITGYAPLLTKLFPESCYYSGNAKFVLEAARRRGYEVEQVEDRR